MLERAYFDHLAIPKGFEGRLWRYAYDGLERRGHRHAELEFNLVTHGTGEVVLRERRYPLRRGTLLWLFPGQDHLLLQVPGFQMWVLEVDPAVVARAVPAGADSPLRGVRHDESACRVLAESEFARLERLIEQVCARAGSPAVYSAALAHVTLLAWDLYRSAPVDDDYASLHPAVARTLALLREDGGIALQVAAVAAGLSTSRLSHLLKTQLGTTFSQLRTRVRLQRVNALVQEGRHNLLEAALAAGFGSYSQFYRAFRKEQRASPRRALRRGERRG
jgi:AraC-like DNA-binding protein